MFGTIILIVVIVLAGLYLYRNNRSSNPTNDTPALTESQVDLQNSEEIVDTSDASDSSEDIENALSNDDQPEPQSFENLNEAVLFVLDPVSSENFETSKPAGFERFVYKAQEEPYNWAPDGVTASVFLLTNLNMNEEANLDEVHSFYLEVVTPPSCFDCTEPDQSKSYGPFEGKLLRMLE